MFDIFEVPVAGGVLAIAPVPGIQGNYAGDLACVAQWAPEFVISLTELAEMEQMGVQGLAGDLAARGIEWRHFPVIDFGVPDAGVNAGWAALEGDALKTLRRGGRILAHCRGGCGRSGMAVLRLMIAAGEAPDAALARLRQVRPCAVETEAQMVWATG